MLQTVTTLKKREDFLRVAREGQSIAAAGLVLQWHTMPGQEADVFFRVGFTVSRKVGNAVVRNRVRRRLRALAREVLPERALPGYDYVFIGRGATIRRTYDRLRNDLLYALHQVKKGASE